MKRSEMLAIISTWLSDNCEGEYGYVGSKDTDEDAAELLEIIEALGMRPPIWLDKIVEVEGQDLKVFSNVWTPEDAEIGHK